MSKRTRWIATTGVMLALLIFFQTVTSFGSQFLTGSCVNLILAVAAIAGGLWCGVTVAVISPFFAFLLGIGPKLIQLVPCISLGNVVLVVSLYFLAALGRGKTPVPLLQRYGAAAVAALLKFLVLFLVVTCLVLPTLGLPAKQAAAMSAMFSWPQLVTALIGSFLAVTIYPILRRALHRPSKEDESS